MAQPLKVVSLFDGIGGFTLAFKRAGMQIVAVVEIDDKARSVTARHFPDVPQFADVREVGAHNLPACDVVCGGFPCQDLSVAGKRLGFAGERSSLFFEMVRIVNELRPAFLVWENVPGLLSSNNGRDFAAVLMALDNIGYSGAWTMLDAQFFGLAQRRRRIFGVFARSDIGAGRCAEILSLATRLSGHPAPGRGSRTLSAAVAANCATDRCQDGPDDDRVDIAAPIMNRSDKGGFGDPKNDNLVIAPEVSNPLGSNTHGQRTTDIESGAYIVEEEPMTFDWQQGASGDNSFRGKGRSWIHDKPGRTRSLTANHTLAVAFQQNQRDELRELGDSVGAINSESGMHNQNFIAFESRFARNGRGAPSNLTSPLKAQSGVTGKGDGAPLVALEMSRANVGVRRLTPTECERLQGFPDGWTELGVLTDKAGKYYDPHKFGKQADSVRYRQLGNAVAVPVVEWIARRLVANY